MESYVITALLIYTILREIVFLYQSNKLINKLMSRSYHEYQAAERLSKPKEKIKLPTEPIEDLSILDHNYQM